MTGPTREEVLEWARSIEGVRVFDMGGSIFGKPEYLERFAALAFAAGSRSGEDARDAARYRWLREHKRYRLACVLDLHGWKASGEDHDAAIDAAMGGNDA